MKLKPNTILYWKGVDYNFNTLNKVLKWTLVPLTLFISCAFAYLNWF